MPGGGLNPEGGEAVFRVSGEKRGDRLIGRCFGECSGEALHLAGDIEWLLEIGARLLVSAPEPGLELLLRHVPELRRLAD